MTDSCFMSSLKQGNSFQQDENVFKAVWKEYERVIIESLISSFGLDFIITDRYGGDVDTINNVRKIGSDPEMYYKNPAHKAAYDSREIYDTKAYHGDENFAKIKRDARSAFDTSGEKIQDAYIAGNELFPRQNNTIPRNKQAQLDHTVSAKFIADDRGRILSGFVGVQLANSPDNLLYTNAALNNNKRDKTPEEYIEWCEKNPGKVNWNGTQGETLSEETKEKMRSEYNKAKNKYDRKLATYYTSTEFISDTAAAAGKVGMKMGIRQALGFIIAEVWFCTKAEMSGIPANSDLKTMLKTAKSGIEKGFQSAKTKYKDIIAKFAEGGLSGILSSLSTTLCNIFFTTSKHLAKIIRQLYASVVAAGRTLLLNPDNLLFGDRLKKTAVLLATGAGILTGTFIGELIDKSPIGTVPVLGNILSTFVSTFVSGILSCTLLIFLDRSKFINELIRKLNAIPSEVNNFREIANIMEKYAAELASIDIEQFNREIAKFSEISDRIEAAQTERELSDYLISVYKEMNIKLPWEGDFDTFMSDRNNRLVFK